MDAAQGRPARRSRCATSRSRSARTTWWSRTFGRGFYVLDDLTPLRVATPARPRAARPLTFPVKKALAYIPATPLGLKGKAFHGETFYTAPNPPFGAVFTYYLKDEVKTKRKARLDAEKEADKKGAEIALPDAGRRCAPRRARRTPRSCSP